MARTLSTVVMLAVMAGLANCGDPNRPPDNVAHYPNGANDAALVLEIYNFGGAAGFVRNELSLEVAGAPRQRILTFSHLSDSRVTWTDDHRAVFCYVGSVDGDDADWSGVVAGGRYAVILQDRTGTGGCSVPLPEKAPS